MVPTDLNTNRTTADTDLSFITNDETLSLKERFEVLIRNTSFFDCLVGYFYASGFHSLYKSLENTEKIRILIGISTNRQTFDMLEQANRERQAELQFSHAETKDAVEQAVENELTDSADSKEVEEGVNKFIEWIKSGKLELKAYPSQQIHAKLYIMTFREGDRDIGRVITGSSNFTEAGFNENLEFNVELKNSSDYKFAQNNFNALWNNAVDVSERYVQTIQDKTWLTQKVSPYELYLKFLYEYFKDELNQTDEMFMQYLPPEFKKLEYQEQAVLNAKKILLEYGGVFISDVVGLGKTYISAMLTQQLEGKTLVIAPPKLLDRSNPGSWRNVFFDFQVPAHFESLGKLEKLLEEGVEKFTNVIVDEAHRYRTETTQSYEQLAEICRGKRVILVTATPYNNSPGDILSLLKLFQKPRQSTIPNLPDLESFFRRLQKKADSLDRQTDYNEYLKTMKENAREIRDKVLKYLMVRRTRTEIERYFPEDINTQKLQFPEVEKPQPLFYELNEEENEVFNRTMQRLTGELNYSRYSPLLYYKGSVGQLEEQSQKNMRVFMKVLLVKRLESSFYAFKQSVNRFLHSYELFIKHYDQGTVYVSRDYTHKIFDLLEEGDDAAIQKMLDEGKAEKYESKDFRKEFRDKLEEDRKTLTKIKDDWSNINRDPKMERFLTELSQNKILKNNHLILFTESKETAQYVYDTLIESYTDKALLFTGDSKENVRDLVIENFDARARNPSDDYRILVATEVLSEGVNLHRSNTVINYDIPWNPTRMMQRVGRINRVDTPADRLHTFNFFPTVQANKEIQLKEAAEGKIHAFLNLLGGDAELLTEGEPVDSHELFSRLVSKKPLEEDEAEAEMSELKYLNEIKEIRDNDSSLFEKIKRLPKKSRTSKPAPEEYSDSLITYFRRGKLQKFFINSKSMENAEELDFIAAAQLLASKPEVEKAKIPAHFYELLDKNKEAFVLTTTDEAPQPVKRGGQDSATRLVKIIKATLQNAGKLTDDQEDYLKNLLTQLTEGGVPKKTAKKAFNSLNALGNELNNPLKVLAVLQQNIPDMFLHGHYAENKTAPSDKREIVLSLYLGDDCQ